ncbi:MAG TPA: choice-of-anchor D domain-containing protein, partial [Polyangia bacterium]|nr:choice-of-anchor D domain-containing protein [Polyangia bacterium]
MPERLGRGPAHRRGDVMRPGQRRWSILLLAAMGCGGQGAQPAETGDAAVTDSAEAPALVDTGTPADVAVEPEAAPDAPLDGPAAARLVLDPSEQNFGGGVAGCPSSPSSFRITNAGESPSGQLAVMTGADFPVVADSCAGEIVPAGGSCTVAIQFRRLLRESSSTLVVSAHPGGTVAARLKGFAIPDDSLFLIPNAADFGSIGIGATSPPRSFELKNIGGMTLTIGQATTSTQNFFVAKDDCRDRDLGPGETCQLAVSYRPQSIGAHSALLTVLNVGCSHAVAQAALNGFAVSP